MNLQQLPDWFRQNPKAAGGAAAVGLLGVVVWRRHASAGASTSAGTDGSGGVALTPAGSTLSTGSQLQGGVDTSGTDAYNALEPLVEQLQNQVGQLQDTIPVPAPPAHVTPTPSRKPTPAKPTPTPSKNHPTPAKKKPTPKKPAPTHRTIPVHHPAPAKKPAPTYTVKRGDTLTGIAARFPSQTITASSIYGANRKVIGSNRNLIRPGERLVIR